VETQCAKTKTGVVQKGAKMLKQIMIDIRAALMLIASEDINALRVLFKNLATLASKSACVHKKT